MYTVHVHNAQCKQIYNYIPVVSRRVPFISCTDINDHMAGHCMLFGENLYLQQNARIL